METTMRRDGRLPSELRPLIIKPGMVNRCDGAIRLALDRTEVIVAIHGPYESKRSRECPDRATLDVVVLPPSGRSGSLQREFQLLVLRALQQVIIAGHYPHTIIQVVIQVMLDDGALLSAALNAASLALARAGVSLRGMIAVVTFALMPTGQAFLDPTADEQQGATSVTTLCYLLHCGAWEADDLGQLLLSHVQGTLERSEYDMLNEWAQKAALAVAASKRHALQRSFVSLQLLSRLNCRRSSDLMPL